MSKQQTNDLGELCPPCKLLLNSGGAHDKLTLFEGQLHMLNNLGYDLTPEGYAAAIKVVCGFDDAMDGVLKLLTTSVQKKASA